MMGKIKQYHKEKMAYVYIRQSSIAQVVHHQESTERHSALKMRALEFGWPMESIRVLDGDLGISGAQMSNREDFKLLVADVSLNKVGAIFALEASRLSRSSTDWNRLFDLCSLTDTLIIDEDGCYNPQDFNDQLLLGLKGMMSQAELHFIRARLQGAKLNKAKKGKLRFPLPVGLCYDDEDRTVLDPDEEVRNIVKFVFETFRETGSAYAVVQKFGRLKLKFPKRAYGGIWKGKLIWGRLCHGRVLNILKNPSYAGAYVYGRYKNKKILSTDGTISCKIGAVPMSSWQVTIKDHHERYISWEEFLHNKALLQQNRTNGAETMLSSAVREGIALLQGLIICGICGRRMTVRYQGNGGLYPIYECNWRKREGLTGKSCLAFRCDIADKAIARRILEVLKPDQIEIALRALEELEKRNKAIDKQWRMKLQRAEYQAQLAQRRYEEVDPANRLVASTLERRWNNALVNLEQVKQQHYEYQQKNSLIITSEKKQRILALAQDLPALWKAPTTKAKDRKRIVRLLIKDITAEKISQPKELILHLRWQGGASEDIHCDLPLKMSERLRYKDRIINQIRELAKTLIDGEIAQVLNQKGQISAKGKPFTISIVRWIRYAHSIPSPELKGPGELTVKEVAEKFNVSTGAIYYWIQRGYLKARRIHKGYPLWITLDSEKEKKLVKRILTSSKLPGRRTKDS